MSWALATGAGVSALGGLFGSKKVASAEKAATAEQKAAREQAQANLSPYMDAGRNALMPVQDLAGVNGADAGQAAMEEFFTSPGYQFQMDEGVRAVDNGAAARGMLRSGATLKAEQKYGSDLANQEFGTFYNRLNALAGTGLQAASASAGVGQQAAANIGQTQASGATAQASLAGNLASGVGGALNQYANISAYQDGRNALMPSMRSMYGTLPAPVPFGGG